VLAELRAAIDAAAWPRALDLALAAWRETRAPELADLVDALVARCEQPTVAKWYRLQPWWMELAATYQPTAVSALVAVATDRQSYPVEPDELARFTDLVALVPELRAKLPDHGCLVARFAAMRDWPDDPRVTRLLARWLREGPLEWRDAHTDAMRGIYRAIATRLVAIADPRVRPLVEAAIAEPRGQSDATRAYQIELATEVLAAIVARPPTLAVADAEMVAAWCAELVLPILAAPESIDIAALWREAARAPDDEGRLMVLADALLECGDDRGELIALQCSSERAAAVQARSLLMQNWERWLGDLALLIKRTRTEFRRGLIVEIQVGRYTTPPWVYAKVRGHRELLAVRTIRPHHAIAPAHFVEVVDGLEHVPERIAITPVIFDELVARRERWPVRAIEYKHRYDTRGRRAIEDVFARIATVMPELTEIRIELGNHPDYDPAPLIESLPAAHPHLTRIVVAARDRTDRSFLAGLGELPMVEIVTS
jgi:hypothetical protein